mmetsp:Transcript_9852/g.14710  ORF Transcript_9852/g.14710 Transcript_9852/m.14710 type:complete len:228 (+) Transcript_9852:93-776(+)
MKLLLLDLDPLETATCMTFVIGALGLTYMCLPQLLFSIFGGKHSPLNHRLVQTYGSGVLGTIITMYCLIIKETSLAQAVQLSQIPYTFEYLRYISGKELGYYKHSQEMELFLAVFAAYAMTQPYAEIVLKLLVVCWLIYAVLLISAPKSTTTMTCGSFKTWDETSKLMIRMIGFNILAHIGVVGSILFGGAGNLKAFGIGYSCWFFKLLFISVLTDDAKNAGLSSWL